MIQPDLSYSAEVWGLMVDYDPTEKVHLYACKRFLNVAACTPKKMVCGELGRHPLKNNYFVKSVKFWFRLLHMDATRILYQAYRMLVSLDSDGKCNWVTKLRQLLRETGFCYVWLTQGAGDELHFIRIFRQRLTDINFQEWVAGLNASSRFDFYREFKTALNAETYLDCIKQKCYRDC